MLPGIGGFQCVENIPFSALLIDTEYLRQIRLTGAKNNEDMYICPDDRTPPDRIEDPVDVEKLDPIITSLRDLFANKYSVCPIRVLYGEGPCMEVPHWELDDNEDADDSKQTWIFYLCPDKPIDIVIFPCTLFILISLFNYVDIYIFSRMGPSGTEENVWREVRICKYSLSDSSVHKLCTDHGLLSTA